MAKLVSRLNIISKQSDAVLEKAIEETADFILTLIRFMAPIDTGLLRSSYEKRQRGPLHVFIGTIVPYSIYLEYGTRRMRARPHLSPSFQRAEPFMKRKLPDWLKTVEGVE